MKPYLLFLLIAISYISVAQKKIFDQTDSVRNMIVREFEIIGKNPIVAGKLYDSLNKKFGVGRILIAKSNTGLSYYFPSGLMLIDKDYISVYEEWIGELSHAKQFSERKLHHTFRAVRGFVQTFGKALFHSKDYKVDAEELIRNNNCPRLKAYLWVAYRDQYDQVGSFEHEAHKVIEPALRKFFLQKLQTKTLASL